MKFEISTDSEGNAALRCFVTSGDHPDQQFEFLISMTRAEARPFSFDITPGPGCDPNDEHWETVFNLTAGEVEVLRDFLSMALDRLSPLAPSKDPAFWRRAFALIRSLKP